VEREVPGFQCRATNDLERETPFGRNAVDQSSVRFFVCAALPGEEHRDSNSGDLVSDRVQAFDGLGLATHKTRLEGQIRDSRELPCLYG